MIDLTVVLNDKNLINVDFDKNPNDIYCNAENINSLIIKSVRLSTYTKTTFANLLYFKLNHEIRLHGDIAKMVLWTMQANLYDIRSDLNPIK